MDLKEAVDDLVRDLERYGRRYDTKRFHVEVERLERALEEEMSPKARPPVRSPLATVLMLNAELRRREAEAARGTAAARR